MPIECRWGNAGPLQQHQSGPRLRVLEHEEALVLRGGSLITSSSCGEGHKAGSRKVENLFVIFTDAKDEYEMLIKFADVLMLAVGMWVAGWIAASWDFKGSRN